jgi:hypothetical protein
MFNIKVANFEQSFDNFYDAFKVFYEKVKEMISGGSSWQVLETMVWIEYVSTTPKLKLPMMFYEARDLAYDIGLLIDKGEIVEIAPGEQLNEEFFRNKFVDNFSLDISEIM